MSGGIQVPLKTCTIPFHWWSMVVVASCLWGCFSEGKLNAAKNSDILNETRIQSSQDLTLSQRVTFQQDNDLKQRTKIIQKQLREDSVNILEWSSQSHDLNPIKHLWSNLKISVYRQPPSNLTELERVCREEWQKPPYIQTCMWLHTQEVLWPQMCFNYTKLIVYISFFFLCIKKLSQIIFLLIKNIGGGGGGGPND